MTARETVQVPKLGSLEIEPEDWKFFVRHVKKYTADFEKALDSKDEAKTSAEFVLDILFVVVRSGARNRIELLPTYSRSDKFIPSWAKRSVNVQAFGIVKAISGLDRGIQEVSKLQYDTEAQAFQIYGKSALSLEPDTDDVKLSVELDKTIGRSLYYIIMNVRFEYEIYRTPMESAAGILKPVEEEEPVPSEGKPLKRKDFGGSDMFECCDCGERFKSVDEARLHIESEADATHRIFRLQSDD